MKHTFGLYWSPYHFLPVMLLWMQAEVGCCIGSGQILLPHDTLPQFLNLTLVTTRLGGPFVYRHSLALLGAECDPELDGRLGEE